jgi:hypothetical protein
MTAAVTPPRPLHASIQGTSLTALGTAAEPVAGVVTDVIRWRAYWTPHEPPSVDFAQDDVFVVDTTAACGPEDAYLHGDVVRLSWPTIAGCPVAPTRWSIAVRRDLLPHTITFVPVAGTSLRAALDAGAFAFATTEPSTNTQPRCIIRSAPSGALVQPTTITLPNGRTFPIPAGDPMTRPDDVTIDGDGATNIGSSPQGAASLLWGSAARGRAFAGLDKIKIGSTVTLTQAATPSCIQHWRVVAVAADNAIVGVSTPVANARPALTLVGFEPGRAGNGPNALFDVLTTPT